MSTVNANHMMTIRGALYGWIEGPEYALNWFVLADGVLEMLDNKVSGFSRQSTSMYGGNMLYDVPSHQTG